jgi:hypothetical protein
MLLFIRVTNNTEEIELLEKPNLKKNNLNNLFPFAKFCEESTHVTKTQNAL